MPRSSSGFILAGLSIVSLACSTSTAAETSRDASTTVVIDAGHGGYDRGGCLVSIALGFIGALLGSWLAGKLGLPELITLPVGDMKFPIVWSIIGAALFVAVINLISRRPAV